MWLTNYQMTFLILITKQITLQLQLLLLHHHLFIQYDQINLTERHDSNYFQNENKIFIPKFITKLQHFIFQEYKILLYLINQMSKQLLMTFVLIILLPIMTITALSKYIPKQITLILKHLFRLYSFYLFISVQYT